MQREKESEREVMTIPEEESGRRVRHAELSSVTFSLISLGSIFSFYLSLSRSLSLQHRTATLISLQSPQSFANLVKMMIYAWRSVAIVFVPFTSNIHFTHNLMPNGTTHKFCDYF